MAEFDPETGALRVFDRAELPDGVEPAGCFGVLGAAGTAVFYRGATGLFLHIGDETFALEHPGTRIHWEQADPATARLDIHRIDESPRRFEYPTTLNELRQDASFGMFREDFEDFDFGLFVSNVLAAPGRRVRIFAAAEGRESADQPDPTRVVLYSYARDLRPEKVAEFTWNPTDGVALTVLDAEWGALAWDYFKTGIPAPAGRVPASAGPGFMRALLRPNRATYYRFVDESS
ncbi:hypothetical protein [Nocardia sp. CC227C]|uniref:hypothetical protein n=1 Tax=Nocardia sp. CC227C TaxID=3044562 RepID=UPI00278C7648|nr:hypothetical protein [Nocardia sp. CC227C]